MIDRSLVITVPQHGRAYVKLRMKISSNFSALVRFRCIILEQSKEFILDITSVLLVIFVSTSIHHSAFGHGRNLRCKMVTLLVTVTRFIQMISNTTSLLTWHLVTTIFQAATDYFSFQVNTWFILPSFSCQTQDAKISFQSNTGLFRLTSQRLYILCLYS